MMDSIHPSPYEIREYVNEMLPDDKQIQIGEHIYTCKECLERARSVYKKGLIIKNWSAQNTGELLWRKRILNELKNGTITKEWSSDLREGEKLAAESSPDKDQPLIKRYYSKDKKIIATAEYIQSHAEVSFETREAELAGCEIVFALVRMNIKEIVLYDHVKIEKRGPGIWETRWNGKIFFSPDLTLLFTCYEPDSY